MNSFDKAISKALVVEPENVNFNYDEEKIMERLGRLEDHWDEPYYEEDDSFYSN